MKFAAGAPTSENSSIDTNLNQGGSMYKRRRSTIALLKNTIAQTKLNKVALLFFILINGKSNSKIRVFSKSDSSIKCVTSDAEAFLIYIGVVDYLDRPGKYIY